MGTTGNQWTTAPSMSFVRSSHTCNLITTSGGDKEIVVVGGLSFYTGGSALTVEIYSVVNPGWRNGNNFPTSIRQHASTAYYDSFIVAGGINSDTIYQYQKDTDSWVQLNISMSADDYAFLSIMIAEDICL